MRVETLNDGESQVLDAIRTLVDGQTRKHYAAGQREIQNELEGIYDLLNNLSPVMWEETVQEARDRLYRLLW